MSKTVKILDEFKINYLTQAQYDAEVAGGTVQPDELYLTPSADYSTSEVNTGKKWIDGRPIYRKTYSFTTPEAPTGDVLNVNFLVDSSFLPTYFMVSCFGFINASGGIGYIYNYTIPYTRASVVTVQGTAVYTVLSSVHPYVYKPFISGTAGLYLSFFGQDESSLYQKPAALTVEYVKP